MARMVNVGDKDAVKRVATAKGRLTLKKSTLRAIEALKIEKGDVVSASKIAGIQAAKATSTTLPLCHQIPLTSVRVNIEIGEEDLTATCEVEAFYKTGVEMEALVGVATALLNAWDMVKYLEKDPRGQYPGTAIKEIRVVSKVKAGD